MFKERRYKIWKQFTTKVEIVNFVNWLCSKNEDTKSESNSQRHFCPSKMTDDCVQRTKIQNLKAIHNAPEPNINSLMIVFKERRYKIWKQFTTNPSSFSNDGLLCSKNEDTKSESNSQPWVVWGLFNWIVFKERRYKIWKQFTTETRLNYVKGQLCSKNEDTKSESNSQPFHPSPLL